MIPVSDEERIYDLEAYNRRLVEELVSAHLAYRNDITRILISLEHFGTVLEARAAEDMKEISSLRAENAMQRALVSKGEGLC
jgi:hypothetical protein